jgi:hypothetical protein
MYALFGLYFLLSCQKSQSSQDSSNRPIHVVLVKEFITEKVVPDKLDVSDSVSLPTLELSCGIK